MNELTHFFDTLWRNYTAIAPNVSRIAALLEARGEVVQNDHVAFRTLDCAPITIAELGKFVLGLGYEAFDDYEFPAKKVRATAYVHPQGGPRIFLSELMTAELSPTHAKLLQGLANEVPVEACSTLEVFTAGRLWEPIAYETYLELQEESEYGAWVAALGLRPNHFTVNVNALVTLDGINDLLDFVEDAGYPLNMAGGRVKGSRDVCLEQASTLADRIEVDFAGGVREEIPTCYYEFALRHELPSGELYQGFVATSADKIFESTNAR